MRNEIRLRPFECFTEVERRELGDIARERGWKVVFLHHQTREREFGYLYAGKPSGRPDWLVARDGPVWILSNVGSGEVDRLDNLAQLADAVGANGAATCAA